MEKLSINNNQLYVFDVDSGLNLGKESIDEIGETVFSKQKYIGNFMPRVDSLVEMYEDGNSEQYAKITLQFADGDESESLTLPLKGLEKTDWSNNIDLRCILNPDVGKANGHIANVIRLQCAKVPVERMTTISRLGTHLVEDIPVFCAGDRLIWPKDIVDKPSVKWSPQSNIRLAINPNCLEEEAVAGMMRVVNLSPEAGTIIFAQNLLYVMREAFTAAGTTPHVIVYLHGKTGVKKTTYSRFQTQIYNRDEPLEPLTRLNATIAAAVNLLYEKSECVVVFDDLFPAKDREIHRQQEKTLLELTRVIGDGIEPARMRGWKVAKEPPRCGVLFTGEYYIGSGSDAARLLPVNMATPIDNDKLTACQNEPLILSTFYSYFITWYITHFYDIINLLKEWIEVYRGTKTDIHARLQETQFCLEAAFTLFLTYCKDKGFVSHEAAVKRRGFFYQQLRAIVRSQNDCISSVVNAIDSAHSKVDYLALIRSIYHDKCFHLSDSVKDFSRGEHDGVIHDDCLFLRREKLMARLKVYDPLADFENVLNCLKEQQALRAGKDGSSSRKLHGGGRGLNFYAIRLGKLR